MKKTLLAALVLPLFVACASGKGRTELMLDNINAVDVLVLEGIAYTVYEIGGRSVWEAETAPAGGDSYRVTLRRNRFVGTGDGEAAQLFKRHAERIAAAQSCLQYRVLEFQERYESLLLGSQRVAEGLIECVRGNNTAAPSA